jgi:hypothetical protein
MQRSTHLRWLGSVCVIAAAAACGGRGEGSVDTSSNALIVFNPCWLWPSACPTVQWADASPTPSGDWAFGDSASFNPVATGAAATHLVVGGYSGVNGDTTSEMAFGRQYDAANGSLEWSSLDTGVPVGWQANFVASDDAGNVYMAYNYWSPATIGSHTVTGGAFVVAKLSSSGKVLSVDNFTGAATIRAMAINPFGGVVLVGSYTGSITFGSWQLPSSRGTSFVVNLDATLAVTSAWGAAGSGGDSAWTVAVDPWGDTLVAGQTSAATPLFGCPVTAPPPNSVVGAWVVELNKAGGCNWLRAFWPDGEINPLSIAADPAGGAVLAGAVSGTVDFGNETPFSALNAAPFAVSLGGSGQLRWAKGWEPEGTSFGSATAVVVDPSSNVMVGGWFEGSMDLGNGTVTGDDSAGFLIKLDSKSNYKWSMSFDAGPSASGPGFGVGALAVDDAGNVGVAGGFRGTTTIGSKQFSSAGLGLLVFTLSP